MFNQNSILLAQTEGGEGSVPPTTPPPSRQSDNNPRIPQSRQSDRNDIDIRTNPEQPSPRSTYIDTNGEVIAPDFIRSFGPFYGRAATISNIQSTLESLGTVTGTKQALVYVLKTNAGLRTILVTENQSSASASTLSDDPTLIAASNEFRQPIIAQQTNRPEQFITKLIPEATPKKVDQVAKDFTRSVSDPSNIGSRVFIPPAQQLYDWIIRPLETDLAAQEIDTLVFILDEGLRTLPVAALYDGSNYLVERYNLALIPSFSLTDTRYRPMQGTQLLGFGISEAIQGLSALPSVSVEVPTLTENLWQGEAFLNEQATLAQLQQQTRQKQFDIIHLATHAEFKSGSFNQSYIQLWDQRISYSDLRDIAKEAQWNKNPTIELLVLSACQTALGSKEAELGFSGLALQTGVKSALGSLWFVSDEGTLGLMSEFYENLDAAPIKAAALREAQLSLLNGTTKIENDELILSNGTSIDLPEQLRGIGTKTLVHPYYWSSFTLVGNWN